MKTLLLLPLILITLHCPAQVASVETQQPNCKMNVEDILMKQPFDIDDPKAEFARDIAADLLVAVNSFYDITDNNSSPSSEILFLTIDGLISDGHKLGMNLDMFSADLDNINSIRQRK